MSGSFIHDEIRRGESDRTEFVERIADYDAIAGAVCAFMNGDGGTIVCGVGHDRRIIGIPEADLPFLSGLENRLRHEITPTPAMTVDHELEDGVRLVTIAVPAGLDGPYMFRGRMLLRQGAETIPGDAYELRARVQLRMAQPIRWERRTASNLRLEDLDLEEVSRTVERATTATLYDFQRPADSESVLRELALLAPDGLTNGADVAFGRDPAVRHPQVRARILRYASDKTSRTGMTDRQFSGPIAEIYERMIETLRAVVSVRSTFAPDQSEREQRPDFAFEALREGLINAFAHRDYASFSGGLKVSVYPGRIEIWNSGRLPEALEARTLGRSGVSLPVNPDIARVLHYRRLMEMIGRGTRLIAEASRKLGAKAPVWRDDPTGVTLIIYAAPARDFGTLPLNVRQEAALEGIEIGGQVTTAEYRVRFAPDLSERQARRDLTELEQDGFFVRAKGGASSIYRRTDLLPRRSSS